jgi:hypothetical protein
MSILGIIYVGVLVVCFVWLVIYILQAPAGHEDADGFHYDKESDDDEPR